MIERSEKFNLFLSCLPPLIVLAVTLTLFSGILRDDFVMWDDDVMILSNHKLMELDVPWAFTDVDSTMSYAPLALLSWQITYLVDGFSPFWFHFGNWLFHGLSALLLFFSLREMLTLAKIEKKYHADTVSPFARDCAAASAALLWAIHPLRVEPVAWASTRPYCQAVFFLFGSLFLYLRSHRFGTSKASKYHLVFSVIFYIASLLSLPLGMSFFVALFMLDLFLLNKVDFSNATDRWGALRQVLTEKLLFALPALGIAITSVVIRYTSHSIWEKPVDLSQFGVVPRLMQAMYLLAYYLWKSLSPVNLAPLYTTLITVDPMALRFIGSATMVGAVSVGVLLLRKRLPFLLGIWISYLALMMPFLGLFEHPYFSSDRFSLLSSLCFSVLAAFTIVHVISRSRIRETAVVVITILALLGWATYKQTAIWSSTESLLARIIETLGDDPYRTKIWGRLGEYYVEAGQPDKAIPAFNEVLKIKPMNIAANSRLAALYVGKKMFAEALGRCRVIIAQDPGNRDAHYEMGIALTGLNRRAEAKQQFDLADRLAGAQHAPAAP